MIIFVNSLCDLQSVSAASRWPQVRQGTQTQTKQWTCGQGRSPGSGATLLQRRIQGGDQPQGQGPTPYYHLSPRTQGPPLRVHALSMLLIQVLLAGTSLQVTSKHPCKQTPCPWPALSTRFVQQLPIACIGAFCWCLPLTVKLACNCVLHSIRVCQPKFRHH